MQPDISHQIENRDLMLSSLQVRHSNLVQALADYQIDDAGMSHITLFEFLCKSWHQIIEEAVILHQVLLIVQSLLKEKDVLLVLILSEAEYCDHIFICKVWMLPHDIIQGKTASLIIVIVDPRL